MILFLYGQDTYRSREELRRVISDYKKANKDWLDFVKIDANNNEIDFFEQVRRSADTLSMFNQGRLIIIENIFSSNKEFQENILEFFKKRNIEKDKDTTIIFWDEKPDKKSALFKYLNTKAEIKEFESLKETQLKNWIKKYIEEQKGKTDSKAIEKLIEYIGSDLWRMSNEINKLLDYSETIKIEDVETLVKAEIDLNIFSMVDALGYKNKNEVLKIFNQFLEKGEDEGYLLAMFVYQIRNLVKVKSGGKLDMHPFVIRKTTQQAKSFNFEDLKKIYYQLLTIDLDIKIGKTDAKTALELFLAQL